MQGGCFKAADFEKLILISWLEIHWKNSSIGPGQEEWEGRDYVPLAVGPDEAQEKALPRPASDGCAFFLTQLMQNLKKP